MAISPKRFIPGSALTTDWVIYYTVPTYVTSATSKQLIVCNNDTVTRSFYLAVVPPDGSPTDANTIFHGVTLQANETKVFGLTDVMVIGTTIQAKAGEVKTTNDISVTMSGMENT